MANARFKKGDTIHDATIHNGQIWWHSETIEELNTSHVYRMRGDNYDTDGEYYDRVKSPTKEAALILLSENTAQKIAKLKEKLKVSKSEHKLVLAAIKKEQGK